MAKCIPGKGVRVWLLSTLLAFAFSPCDIAYNKSAFVNLLSFSLIFLQSSTERSSRVWNNELGTSR